MNSQQQRIITNIEGVFGDIVGLGVTQDNLLRKSQQVVDILKKVIEPDFGGHSIINLGLLEGITFDRSNNKIIFDLVLTSPSCPHSGAIGQDIHVALKKHQASVSPGIGELNVEVNILTKEWTMQRPDDNTFLVLFVFGSIRSTPNSTKIITEEEVELEMQRRNL